MIDIIDPKLVTSEVSEDRRYGKFVWEPLEGSNRCYDRIW